jgi:hypothetical protein
MTVYDWPGCTVVGVMPTGTWTFPFMPVSRVLVYG